MSSQNLLDVIILELPSELGESLLQILLGDYTGTVDVELVEDGLCLVSGQVFFQIDSCGKELGVIYLVVILEVKLVDDLFQIVGSHVHILLSDHVLKIRYLDESALVGVDFLKLILKFIDLVGVQMLHKNVHSGLFEQRLTLKLADSPEDLAIIANLL